MARYDRAMAAASERFMFRQHRVDGCDEPGDVPCSINRVVLVVVIHLICSEETPVHDQAESTTRPKHCKNTPAMTEIAKLCASLCMCEYKYW